MSIAGFNRFLRDESGGYTIWSLIWFSLYVAMGGLAVDVTDAYRNQTMLQSTADASSLAAVMSLPAKTDALAQALTYATDNMNPAINGNVLEADEVIFGNWNFDTKKFTPGTADPDAVRVITRRDDANNNPLATNFLRILGLWGLPLDSWNISVEAVAVKFIPGCIRDGFVAQGEVFFRSGNDFYRKICIHGQDDGVTGKMGNTFETGVEISRGDEGTFDFPPPAMNKPDLLDAIGLGGVGDIMPADVYDLEYIIAGMKARNPDYLPDFMVDIAEDGTRTAFVDEREIGYETVLPANLADLEPMTVYNIDCNGQLKLGQGVVLAQVVIITNCRIHASSDMSAGDVVLASTYVGNNDSIILAGKTTLGYDDGCEPGGGVALYTYGDVKIAAQGEWHGLRIVAGNDVDFTANNDGAYGIAVQAGGDINFRSISDYGLCDGSVEGPVKWRYRLVR